jgi:hypothetical protein
MSLVFISLCSYEEAAKRIVIEHNEAKRIFNQYGSLRDCSRLAGVEEGLHKAVLILQEANLVPVEEHLEL